MPNGADEALVIGVSAKTGRPLPCITAEWLSFMAGRQRKPDPVRSILESRAAPASAGFRGVVAEIEDPNDLAEVGWGVVFARDCDPSIRQALQPLVDLRKKQ